MGRCEDYSPELGTADFPTGHRGPYPGPWGQGTEEGAQPSVAWPLGTLCPSSLWPPPPSDSRPWPCSCGDNEKGKGDNVDGQSGGGFRVRLEQKSQKQDQGLELGSRVLGQ